MPHTLPPALPPKHGPPFPPLDTQVSNVSSSCRAALAASSASLAEKTSSLQTRLDDTLSTFDSIMEGTAELQVEVTDEVIRGLCLLTLLF